MDIPLINSAATSRLGSVAPLAPAQVSPLAQAQTVAALVAQTTVDLSPLGRFLSAVTLFQKKLQELQSPQSPAAAERDAGDAFAATASAVQGVADSANALQASSLNGTSDDQSLSNLFAQQFAAQFPSADDAEDADLAAIGLSFAAPSAFEEGEVLSVDFPLLQAAFEADPAGTTALLARAGAAFGALAGIAPGDGADSDTDPLALPGAAPDPATAPAPGAALAPPAVPEAAEAPAPLTSDGAFLQELLAETPRPTLDQAAPPSVAEASANFAAQNAVDASGSPTTELNNENADAQAAASAQANRTLAEQSSAAQVASRQADERIAGTIAAGRAAQAAELDARSLDEKAATRADEQLLERTRTEQAGNERRLARDDEQQRLERTLEARTLAREQAQPAPLREQAAAASVSRSLPLAPPADPVIVARPLPPPVNAAQQAARDPAIAAAIAAYNLSAGPFAALHAKPELAPPKIKTVPGVEIVTAVEPIADDGPTNTSSRPFR
jgi:hypothetical protein